MKQRREIMLASSISCCLCLLLLHHARCAVLQDVQQAEDQLAAVPYFGTTLGFGATSDVETTLHDAVAQAAARGDGAAMLLARDAHNLGAWVSEEARRVDALVDARFERAFFAPDGMERLASRARGGDSGAEGAEHFGVCGGQPCLPGDVGLFADLRAVALAEWRALRASRGRTPRTHLQLPPEDHNGTAVRARLGATTRNASAQPVLRKLLVHPQRELMEYAESVHELLACAPRLGVADAPSRTPWALHKLRMAHGETIRWLEYHGHTALGNRVRYRGAFGCGLWAMHQESPDSFNEALHALRAENRNPFPPRGKRKHTDVDVPAKHGSSAWPHVDEVLSHLEGGHGEKLFAEFLALNGHDLHGGELLEEHEQGLQEYFFNSSVWFRSTFWKGSATPCLQPQYRYACKFFLDIERRWRERGHRMYFVEIKWLTVHPGVWIRPHTSDNNQNLKIHWCAQNPGSHVRMLAANDTKVWVRGRAHYFQDSFVHQVRTTAPQGHAPRVVLDIKMIHPDLGDLLVPAQGMYTNLPHVDANGRHLLANQLLERCVSLDGDKGREAQYAFHAMMKSLESTAQKQPEQSMALFGNSVDQYFPNSWHLDLCDDLDLDHADFEVWPAAEIMDYAQVSSPLRKRTCMRRLLLRLQHHGWRWYNDHDLMHDFVRWTESADPDEPPPVIYTGRVPDDDFAPQQSARSIAHTEAMMQHTHMTYSLGCNHSAVKGNRTRWRSAQCQSGWACVGAGRGKSLFPWLGGAPQPQGWLAATRGRMPSQCLPCGLLDHAQLTAAHDAVCTGHHSESADACMTIQGVKAAKQRFRDTVALVCAHLCASGTNTTRPRSTLVHTAARIAGHHSAVLEALASGEAHSQFGSQAAKQAQSRAQRRWFWTVSTTLTAVAQLSRPDCDGCALCSELHEASGRTTSETYTSTWPVPEHMMRTEAEQPPRSSHTVDVDGTAVREDEDDMEMNERQDEL